jgi:hypothetical protein
MAAPTIDLGELLVGIPAGAWVALSHNRDRVVAFAPDMRDAIQKANEAGEDHPVILRVPESHAAFVL